MNVKELVKNALRGRQVPRPPFIPLIGSYLTRVSQSSVQETLSDPGLLHQALSQTQQLFRYDAAVMPPDTTLEAEAFGLPVDWNQGALPEIRDRYSLGEALRFDPESWIRQGRLPVFLESANRFSQVEGRQIPLFAVVSGPLTVWGKLYGLQPGTGNGIEMNDMPQMKTIVQAAVLLCKSYAEAGVDGIIINEGDFVLRQGDSVPLSGIYKPIFNVIRHFNRWGVLRLPRQDEAFGPIPGSLGADAVIRSLESLHRPGTDTMRGAVGIPLGRNFRYDSEDLLPVIQFFSKRNRKGVFLTTETPVNEEDIDLIEFQEGIEKITAEECWNSQPNSL